MSIDWRAVKAEFPATREGIDLGTAGGGAMSRAAAAAGRRYFDEAEDGGERHWGDWLARAAEARAIIGRTLGAAPQDVALVASASVGMTLLAQVFAGPEPVVTVDREFPSVTLPFLAQGRDLIVLPLGAGFAVDWDAVDPAVLRGARILAVSHVGFRTGARHDLAAIGRFARRHGLVSIVDATQSAGVMPIDMTAADVDAVVFSAYKWPGGGYGIGAVALNPRHRWPNGVPVQGWRSARVPYDLHFDRLDPTPTAEALELGNVPFPGVFALGAALGFLDRIGIERIAARIHDMVERLIAGLDRLSVPVLSPRARELASGIVIARVPDATAMVEALALRGIRVSRRGADELRVSVHLHTLEEDVDGFLDALAGLRAA